MTTRCWLGSSAATCLPPAPSESSFPIVAISLFLKSSGMGLDVTAIVSDPLRLLIFFGLLLVVRGLP